ncbi:glycosyltransferase family 2 protein [Bifidobacterium sp.]|uniref:glycosyltransferase family 2 protein n=1 Tax=Bifidobacterium sp. TaxID=41200 RepID=UPI0025BBBF2C|nr:glycosyltransferase family 2 protein [Bifidobacterium sp.]MCH4209164.1 glycosyltransferase family 2 protein [Bifidobacterium sp.]MCI1224610.1 glycosyltransferase family 2 protein [Bifidobacterium sp.]
MNALDGTNAAGTDEADGQQNQDIQQLVAGLIASRPYSHRQEVEPTLAAVITVEEDMRFFAATLRAVLEQSILPGVIVIADCAGGVSAPLQSQFEVIPSPAGLVMSMPEAKTVSVRLVGVRDAVSFGDAVSMALTQALLGNDLRAVWMLHDDARPADARCLEQLLETWRNAPTAALLGAKQLGWDGVSLHDVGAYAGRHRIESLVVDGEPDQEQYDGRQDVFAVSLAGALVPIRTLRALGGMDPWFDSYGESADFSRRVCLSGSRVVVVPKARIAHRRARFEGIRSKDGVPLDEQYPQDNALSVMLARQRYRYTDMRRAWWLPAWLWSLVAVLGQAIRHLFAKQPYEAWCVLQLPWHALADMPAMWRARHRVRSQSVISLSKLPTLAADRRQLALWRERRQALQSQRRTVLLDPLARAHLRRRVIRRFGAAAAMSIAAFAVLAALHGDVLGQALSGGSLFSSRLVATQAGFAQLAQAATTPWLFGASTGIPAPPTPWLLVWLLASVVTLGHTAAALTLLYMISAPASALSFWALAGVFTRSDSVRVVCGLLWFSVGVALGLYGDADLAMLTVMIALPAAFAFVFRAVGMYHTEEPKRPHSSVQAAACAALCFVAVVAAQPQLLLPLIAAFLVFLLLIPRHRARLLLIPFPAAFAVAPTVVNSLRYAHEGFWRQLFGDIMIPPTDANGVARAPRAMRFIDIAASAFGVRMPADLRGLGMLNWLDAAALIMLSVVALLAIASLLLPFALRVSRMMWVVAVLGMLLSMVSVRVVVALGPDGPVAGSPIPGFVLTLFALLCCVCQLAGGAVARYRPLLPTRGTAAGRAANAADGVWSGHRHAAAIAARFARSALVTLLAAGAVAWLATGALRADAHDVQVSEGGLPMVAIDYLDKEPGRRILALYVDAAGSVSYNVLRTGRGDLVDSSPAQRAQEVSGKDDPHDATLAEMSARLLVDTDAGAIAELGQLGFGGIYVSTGSSAHQRDLSQTLISNITASDGVQPVVSNDAGAYYRFTALGPDSRGIDTARQQAIQHGAWRHAWLWSAAVLLGLYCLVAVPRAGRELGDEV